MFVRVFFSSCRCWGRGYFAEVGLFFLAFATAEDVVLSSCKRRENTVGVAVIIPVLVLYTCRREGGVRKGGGGKEGSAVRVSISFKKANVGSKICELKVESVLGFGVLFTSQNLNLELFVCVRVSLGG